VPSREHIRMTVGRAPAAVVAVGACLVTTLLCTPSAGATRCGTPATDGAWSRLTVPRFDSGPATATTYAVGAGTVYVTNGAMVVRTTDAGCSWQPVYRVAAAGDEVRAIVVPDTPGAARAYLAVQTAADPVAGLVTAVEVERSVDRGAHWTAGGAVPGAYTAFASAANDPDVLYAVTRRHVASTTVPGVSQADVQAVQFLSRSADAGATWTQDVPSGPAVVAGGVGSNVGNRYDGLLVDPTKAGHVWLWGPDGLYESADGGASSPSAAKGFIATLPVQLGSVARSAAPATAGTPEQLAFATNNPFPMVGYTPAGSRGQLGVLGPPGPVLSLTVGARSGEFVVATKYGVFLHLTNAPAAVPFVNVGPAKVALTDLVPDRGASGFVVYGRSGNTIEWRTMPTSMPTYKYQNPKTKLTEPNQSATLSLDLTKLGRTPPRISPDHMRIGLTVGQRRTVPYMLGLPGSRKVDVYFLVDLSKSMADAIAGLKTSLDGIVAQLQKAGVDGWFGVGAYQSYDRGFAYQRVLDVSPPSPRLLAALVGLRAEGGGNETTLAALYQTATGKGQNDTGAFIAPGQQANFRPDALHLVINATDEGFDAGGDVLSGPAQPSFDQVGQALRAVHALQLGIAYESTASSAQEQATNPKFKPNPSVDERTIANATGAFAPTEGADCNGDGNPDILPGQALVCVVDPAMASQADAIAPAIVNMVLAAPDVQPVSVTWTSKHPVVQGITPKVSPAVNLRFPARLTFQVTYNCPATLPPGVYPANLTARVRGNPVAKAIAQIDCSTPPLPAAAGPLAGLGVATVPAPPSEPVTNAQPQSQPQTQPQSQPQSQAQAQTGAAYQEQQETQFAFAYTNPVGEGERSFSFSRYRSHPTNDGDGLPVYPVAAMLGSLAAVAVVRTRRRTQLSYLTPIRGASRGRR
jgi:hypothetical protein